MLPLWWRTTFSRSSWQRKTFSSSSLILRPPKAGMKGLNRNLRGRDGEPQQLEWGAPPSGAGRSPPSSSLAPRAAAGSEGPLERPRPTGNLRGAEVGRAAVRPARKQNLLPAEAAENTPSPPRLSVSRGTSSLGLPHGTGLTGPSPHLETPVEMGTPWGAGGYSHPSAMTPFRSAKCNFRAGQGFSEP